MRENVSIKDINNDRALTVEDKVPVRVRKDSDTELKFMTKEDFLQKHLR